MGFISTLILLTICLSFLFYPIVARATIDFKSNSIDVKTNTTNLIELACQHSSHKEFCISTLKSDPNSEKSDITGLAFIALNLASTCAKNTTTHIKEMLQGSNLDAFTEQCLRDCSDHYADAIDQIDDSSAALSVKAFQDITTWVKVAILDADTCEECFNDHPDHHKVLSHNNKNLRQLCNNALVMAKLVQAKQ